MRLLVTFLGVGVMAAAGESPAFSAARDILEIRCLECHSEKKPEGGLMMETRESLLKGGDSGAAVAPGKPEASSLLERVLLDAEDGERMPPKDHAAPLTADEIAALREWLLEGAPWLEGERLAQKAATALPRWDAAPDPRIKEIEAFPKTVKLESAADFHRVIVVAKFEDGSAQDVTGLVKMDLENPELAHLDGTTLRPRQDGGTRLRMRYCGLEAQVPVEVVDAGKARAVSFQLDVMPVLTAAGCNMGSCHGAARGQDGFHLSLYGFDPQGDHFRLTEEMAGRRINLALPEESLLITKAVGDVPHTGGKLIEKGSAFHRTLVEWIRDGAGYDRDQQVQPVGIEVEPREVLFAGKELEMPLTVRATYSDGTDRDVSTLSTFSTSNDNSAAIDGKSGVATSKNRGEAFLLARFHTFTEGSGVIVVPDDPSYIRPDFPAANEIDRLTARKWEKLRLEPSVPADDETFLRRLYLDVIGLPPTVEERAAFLNDTRPDKRAALVDALLERPEFTEMWVMKWAELLQIRTIKDGGNSVSYKAALNYYQWLRERISRNVPFNELVAELLSSKGGTFANPASNFYQIEQDPMKLTENVAQVFMGTRIQCAQCHNHPFDRWTMDDYYGFTAFFAQVKRKRAEDPREQIVFDGGGEAKHPVTHQNVPPKFLGGPKPELGKGESRREALAEWMASADNPWFARNVVNIVWAHFHGIGIVDPVDDMRISNPPSNPELLDHLAKAFVSYRYDFKKLVREICNSRTYQLSTQTNETNADDTRNFSHAMIRRMRAEVLLDSISQVTGTPNKFKGLPQGARAVQIADGNTSNYFLTTFGRATRATVCSCEVKMEPNLSQALHLLNGDSTHQRVKNGRVVAKLLDEGMAPAQIIARLYLTTLSREPAAEESAQLAASLTPDASREVLREELEDVFWALLNSKEFIFNH